jgi:hypothetical protein
MRYSNDLSQSDALKAGKSRPVGEVGLKTEHGKGGAFKWNLYPTLIEGASTDVPGIL